MQRNDIISISNRYFDCFANKEFDSLFELFAQGVVLKDWENEVSGIENVVALNKKIFSTARSIEITILYQCRLSENVVFNKIEVGVNKERKISVIDLLSFDEEGRITLVEAYKK